MFARRAATRFVCETRDGHKVRSHSFLNATACPKTTLRIPFQGSQYGPGKSRDPNPLRWEGSMGSQQMAGGISPCNGQRS